MSHDTELISVVAPAFNEADGLTEFHARVTEALAGEHYELVLVDDGSTDGTGGLIARLAAEDPRVKPVYLSRNFGHQAAVTAGIDAAEGGVVVSIDADLQDPPEVIPQLLAAWRDGWDVVHAVRHVRPGETRMRLAAIRGFYRLFTRIGGLQDFPGNSGDFRLIAGPALDALRALPERNRFVRGLVSWVGFRQTSVVYEREARYAGASKYPLRKLLRLGADGVATGDVEAGRDRHLMAEVARKGHRLDPRIGLVQPAQDLPRVVGRAVVDEDELPRLAESFQHLAGFVDEQGQRRGLVEGRRDDGEHRWLGRECRARVRTGLAARLRR